MVRGRIRHVGHPPKVACLLRILLRFSLVAISASPLSLFVLSLSFLLSFDPFTVDLSIYRRIGLIFPFGKFESPTHSTGLSSCMSVTDFLDHRKDFAVFTSACIESRMSTKTTGPSQTTNSKGQQTPEFHDKKGGKTYGSKSTRFGWVCCQCRDGPKSTKSNTRCTYIKPGGFCCNHDKCENCRTI